MLFACYFSKFQFVYQTFPDNSKPLHIFKSPSQFNLRRIKTENGIYKRKTLLQCYVDSISLIKRIARYSTLNGNIALTKIVQNFIT